MKKKYRSKWINISDRKAIAFKDIEDHKIRNPFNHLPQKLILSEEEEELLMLLERDRGYETDEFLMYSILRSKIGIGVEGFKRIQSGLRKLLKDCEEKHINLPTTFLTFFQTYEYLNRFRTSDCGLTFTTSEGLNVFQEDERYFITPFLRSEEDYCWWYLLLNQKGEYCILYNDVYWRDKDFNFERDSVKFEYIICADSFEEFIVRLSRDIKTTEGNGDLAQKMQEKYHQYFDTTAKQILERYPDERKKLRLEQENLTKIEDIIEDGQIKDLAAYLSIYEWLSTFFLVAPCQNNVDKIKEVLDIKQLHLYRKSLGTIPDSIDKLHNLKFLRLYACELIKLPKTMGNLTKLQLLDLERNKLKEIPSELGNLVNLKTLYLGGNQLKEIPSNIVNLLGLKLYKETSF